MIEDEFLTVRNELEFIAVLLEMPPTADQARAAKSELVFVGFRIECEPVPQHAKLLELLLVLLHDRQESFAVYPEEPRKFQGFCSDRSAQSRNQLTVSEVFLALQNAESLVSLSSSLASPENRDGPAHDIVEGVVILDIILFKDNLS